MTEPYENGSPPYNKQMGIVPDGDQNKVIINDEEIKIPDGLQGPGLELSDEQIDLAVYVFGQSLHYLREQFPETKIGVVYIPSPLSSYQISSEVVSISPYDHRVSELIYDALFLHERSNSVFSKIKGAVDEQNIKLIDLRPLVLEYTKKKVIHGPQEWFHFNKEGHALLGRAVINLIHDLNAGR
jgi:hypothetical protein